MAIDLSKVENLLIDEGSLESPFILKDTEVTTLYKLAISGNNKINIKGVVNTTTGTILKYESYQIKKAYPNLTVLAREVTTQDWTVQLLSSNILEGEHTTLIATNISTETLEWRISDVSLSVTTGSYGEQDVRDHLHFDKYTGLLSFDAPTSNAGWVANIRVQFWPSYIEEPTAEDYRAVELTVRAIAVTSVTYDFPSRIDESSTVNLNLAPYPTNNTKAAVGGCKYSIQTTYGTLSPSSGTITDRTTFTYYAPEFKDVPYQEDEEGKYYTHHFIIGFYMFGSTTVTGTVETDILMKNTAFKVTCDKDNLVEAESAEFTVLGYNWDELQKTMVVDELKLVDITEEELRRRVEFSSGPFFNMKPPIDNATYSADVTLFIAPPGADPIGERAFQFPMHLRAQGITNLTLSPQTIGQGIASVINLDYKPANHTKGIVYFSFSCPGVNVTGEDNIHGIYNVFSSVISTEGHDAITKIFTEYIGDDNPLLVTTNKLYVQDIFFNVTFDGEEQREITKDEGEEIQCFVDILHISELKKEITVEITNGADLIDEDFILNKLHFSEDVSTDKIWFDEATENYEWNATITIIFIAKYVPEGIAPPYSQTVTLHYEARKVTGAEWQKNESDVWNNYPINTTPYRQFNDFRIITLPYDNTKQKTLVKAKISESPFSIGALASGITANQGVTGIFSIMSTAYYSPDSPGQWYFNGFVDALSEGSFVAEDLAGWTRHINDASTINISYPKNLTVWKLDGTAIDLCKLDTLCYDNYIHTENKIYHQISKYVLSDATSINLEESGNPNTDSVCFYITISGRRQSIDGWSPVSSHFKAVSDWVLHTNDIDAFNNTADGKTYIRISNTTIGVTDYTQETTDTYREKITRYIKNQYDNGTPITIWYALEVETVEDVESIYFEKPVYQTNPYHIYTANDPVNQCSIEFLNNNTTAVSRTIFGTPMDITEQGNQNVEAWLTDTVRVTSTETTQVPFFAGTKKSINQYRKVGNEYELLTRIISEGSHNLPTEYQEYDYIQPTGSNSCITLPFILKSNVDIEMKFTIEDSLTSTKWFLGGDSWQGVHIDGNGKVGFTSGSSNKLYVNCNRGEIVELKTEGGKIYFNGAITPTGTITRTNGVGNVSLFCYNSGNMNTNGKIFYFKVYESGALIHDFIPCIRIEDNIGGLYDLKTQTFYQNSGTGQIQHGTAINPISVGLLNNTFKFRDYPEVPETEISETIDALTIREKHVTGLRTSIEYGIKYQIDGEWIDVFTNAGGWENETYKTLVFSDKIQTYSNELTEFIQSNSILMELEKGEINVWENFCGKYEEWTDSEIVPIEWTIKGNSDWDGTPSLDNPVEYKHLSYKDGPTQAARDVEIRAIDDYVDEYSYTRVNQDVIIKINRNVGELILTGNETWTIQDRAGLYRLDTNLSLIVGANANAKSNYFRFSPVLSGIWSGLSDGQFAMQTQQNCPFFFKNLSILTVEDWKTWLKEKYDSGNPVKVYFKNYTTKTETLTGPLYDIGNVHRRYTISKILNDDDRIDGRGTVKDTNAFNKGFVFDKEHNIPTKFFLSRFIPGWHNDDSTDIVSMAKGLSSQQRTLTTNIIPTNGCYYKKDDGQMSKIQPINYGPLLAYTWLAYLTYGSLNLKETIGVGASHISIEGQIFQDDSGTPLTVGQSYNTVYILNNSSLTQDTYQKYDFNIIGGQFIAKQPMKTMQIGSIEVGSVYTSITFANYSLFTATVAKDYYSLNACFSKTGYSENKYLDLDNNPVISGYGINANYNDERHPVRCLNVENMWGGGSYVIGGTQFVGDEEDGSIVHPTLWNPEDPEQSLDDDSTWETLTDIDVLIKSGTWDVGSYKYYNTRCAWPEKEVFSKIPYRGFNVYDRPSTIVEGIKYLWLTGTSADWTVNLDDMCGLGQASFKKSTDIDVQSKIPEMEYQEVEYLQSDGSSYINTHYIPQNNTIKLEFKAQKADTSDRRPFGIANSNLLHMSIYGSNQAIYRFLNQNVTYTNTPAGYKGTDAHIYEISKAGGYIIDGTKLGNATGTGSLASNTAELGLFSASGTGSSMPFTGKIWYFRVYENDELIHEYIPVKKRANSEYGMYDTVDGQFFGSVTTTKFTGGPIISHSESLARVCGTL